MLDKPRLKQLAAEHPYPLLFASVSGAHLYGFPSPDSDVDLRGAHITPLERVLGLKGVEQTVARDRVTAGLHLDLVTHDIHFFLTQLVKHSGNMLDQLYSPLVIATSPEHDDLQDLAQGVLCRGFVHHYAGLARSQWKRFGKQQRAKPLLYVYRSLLSGLYLMQSSEVISDITRLNAEFGLPYIAELVARKTSGSEDVTLEQVDVDFHTAEYERLNARLMEAAKRSHLPATPPAEAVARLDRFLVQVRQ